VDSIYLAENLCGFFPGADDRQALWPFGLHDLINPVDRLIQHLPREKKEGTFRLVQCGSRPGPFGSRKRQGLIDILYCQESGVGFLMEQNISGNPGDVRFLSPQGIMLHPDPFPDAIQQFRWVPFAASSSL